MPKFVLFSTLTHDEHEKNFVCAESEVDNLIERGLLDHPNLYKTVAVWVDKDLATAKQWAKDIGRPT